MEEQGVYIQLLSSEPGRGSGQFLHTHASLRIGPAEGTYRDKWQVVHLGSGKFQLKHLSGRGNLQWAHIHGDMRIGPADEQWKDTFQVLDKNGNELNGIPGYGVPFQVRCISGRGNNQFWHIHSNNLLGPSSKEWSNFVTFILPIPTTPLDDVSINYWIKVINAQPGRGVGQYLHTHANIRTGPAEDQWKDSVRLFHFGNGIYKIKYETGRNKGQWLHIHADYRCGPAEEQWSDEFEFYVNEKKVDHVPFNSPWKAKFLSGRGVNQWWHIHADSRLGPADKQWADEFKFQPAESLAKVISLSFDIERAIILSHAPSNILSYPFDNRNSSNPLKTTVTLKKTVENKSSFQRTHGFELGITRKVEVTAGIPEVVSVNASLTVEAKTSHTWTYGEENTTSQEFSVESNIELPPGKGIIQNLIVTEAKMDVPYKLIFETDTGKVLEEDGVWKGTSSTNLRVEQKDM